MRDGVAALAQALVVEAIDLRDLPALSLGFGLG